MFLDYLDIGGLTRVVGNIKTLMSLTKLDLQNDISGLSTDIDNLETRLNTLESGIDWKEAVNTYSDISITYPYPQDGWTVNVKDTNYTYQYNGADWIVISANAIPDATTETKGLMTTAQVTKLNNLQPYVLPPASEETLGGIMPDGVTITVDANGVATALGEDKELDDLKDIEIVSPTNNQVLKYDAGLRKWINGESGGTTIKLDDVSGASVVVPIGETTATIRWTDPSDIVVDNVPLATWQGTKVVRKVGSAPMSVNDGTVIVNSTTRNQYSSTGLQDTNLEWGTTYYYRFFPYTDNNLYTEGSALTGMPMRITIPIPVKSGNLTYDGTEQTQTFTNYDPTRMTATNISATNAGDYIATFTLGDRFVWSDETREVKEVAWSIAKASGSVTLTPASVSLDVDHTSATVIVSNSTGEISSVESLTPLSIYASLESNVITIESLDTTSGTYSVVVTVDESANYNATSATIPIVADFNVLTIVSWADGTDEEIAAMLEAHYNNEINIYDYWTVGDERIVSLSATSAMSPLDDAHTAQTVTMVLMHEGDKELTTSINNHTECAFVVGMKECLLEIGKYSAYNAQKSAYDWSESDRRTWCNSTFKDSIPNTLVGIFKQCKNTTGTYSNWSNYVVTDDYFAFPSEKEIFGTNSWANSTAEASNFQFEYYETVANRTKTRGEGYANYWLRSICDNDNRIIYLKRMNDGRIIQDYQYYNNNECLSVFGVI